MDAKIAEAGAARAAEALSVAGVTVRFDGLAAISGVTLSLAPREIVGLIGPNGAGKTTLVNVLTGFQRPSEGRLEIDGQDALGWSPAKVRRAGVARSFQAGRLFGKLTVLENAQVAAIAAGMSQRAARARAAGILEQVGLGGQLGQLAGSLPYTDQRRLDIARALASGPKYVLLDEPAAGMSDAECEDLMRIIRGLPDRFGCAVLLIEHNMHVVMSLSDRLHVLDGGRTIVTGTPAEVQANQAFLSAYLGAEVAE
ncbi:ABC transporter ATP-binding protein [Poseidonocella sp. HB161398]|uniref:ABC transporter ATP-binding protein n=1 Tax=Poseidonocella sp. HB161398 TaxID=2320855 RepID=UPI00110A0126|nr:ABC transporter ATP-binding protein [Poseidonocella sp. HB161398]